MTIYALNTTTYLFRDGLINLREQFHIRCFLICEIVLYVSHTLNNKNNESP